MYKRYAVYFVPDAAWGDFGATWLGWDNRSGRASKSDEPELTNRPRKYGFHATIKPPFRLAEGQSVDALGQGIEELCATFRPFTLSSLNLSQIGRFFALTAPEEQDQLRVVADAAVQQLDPFRAALNDTELARRRQSRLSEAQELLLQRWGYPYVMEEFRFHLTLTGPVKDQYHAKNVLQQRLAPMLSQPMQMDGLSLLGEDDDGRFHQIARVSFSR